MTRDAGPVKGGSTEIAFVEVRVEYTADHLRLQLLGCCQMPPNEGGMLRNTPGVHAD